MVITSNVGFFNNLENAGLAVNMVHFGEKLAVVQEFSMKMS